MKDRRGVVAGRGLAAAIILCLGLTAMPTAHAQMTASPAFRQAVEAAQSSLKSGNISGASAAISGLSPSSPLEKYMAASLAMELAVKRGDVVAQRRAVAAILESGAAPEGQLAYLNGVAGYLSYQTGAIDNAVTYLGRARQLGDTDAKTALMLVEAYARQRKPREAAALLDQIIAAQKQAGKSVPASWYDRASSFAFARKDWAALAGYSAAKLAVAPVQRADWRSALVTYMAGADPEKEARLDLYRLQAATDALASERDYQGYATLAADQGYAAEAKTIIEVGQSKSKLAKVDPVITPLMRTLGKKAVVNLNAIKGLPGKAGSVASAAKAAQNGDDLLANSQYAEAVPYYRAALAKGGGDKERVTTRLGIALARSGDLEGARQALAQVTDGRWAQIAAYWRAWVDIRSREAQASAAASAPSGA